MFVGVGMILERDAGDGGGKFAAAGLLLEEKEFARLD